MLGLPGCDSGSCSFPDEKQTPIFEMAHEKNMVDEGGPIPRCVTEVWPNKRPPIGTVVRVPAEMKLS